MALSLRARTSAVEGLTVSARTQAPSCPDLPYVCTVFDVDSGQRVVALLRGVNVGGHNKVPMADLRTALASAGFVDPVTHLNSGNAIFSPQHDASADELEPQVEAIIYNSFGVRASVLIRTAADMGRVVDDNPFPEHVGEGSKLFVIFLRHHLDAAPGEGLVSRSFEPDGVFIGDRLLYAWCQGGASNSDLMDSLPKLLGRSVITTTRNWNTVTKVLALLQA